MDYQAFGLISGVIRVLAIMAALGAAGVAVVVAAYCTKKKLRPAAAWILALSWAGIAFMFIVVAVMDYVLMPRFGWNLMRYAHIGSELIFIVLGVLMAAGVGMFRPLEKTVVAGREVGHGA